jgi:prepilin-type N-terminal cleavage/methylation domain-containing protein
LKAFDRAGKKEERLMKRLMKGAHGFTLIELVLVIAILGILAVAALPSLFNISLSTAKNNSMAMTVSSVQEGISLYAANQVGLGNAVTYPTTLDGAAAGSATGIAPFFGNVLQAPVASQWIKISSTCYVYDFLGTGVAGAGDTYFQYTTATGAFTQVATCS